MPARPPVSHHLPATADLPTLFLRPTTQDGGAHAKVSLSIPSAASAVKWISPSPFASKILLCSYYYYLSQSVLFRRRLPAITTKVTSLQVLTAPSRHCVVRLLRLQLHNTAATAPSNIGLDLCLSPRRTDTDHALTTTLVTTLRL